MDLTNPFGVSGNVSGYINMHNLDLFAFRNKILQYMSATTQVAAKKINEKNHKRALGAEEGFPNEDATQEYEDFSASKSEISLGQEILGGEDCNVPILNNCIARQ